jgi:hypothetical protein
MFRSESSRSGIACCKCKSASKPSFAVETSYPSSYSTFEIVRRTVASSSTTRIRVLGLVGIERCGSETVYCFPNFMSDHLGCGKFSDLVWLGTRGHLHAVHAVPRSLHHRLKQYLVSSELLGFQYHMMQRSKAGKCSILLIFKPNAGIAIRAEAISLNGGLQPGGFYPPVPSR